MRWPWVRRPKWVIGSMESGPMDQLYVAVVHADDREAMLLWVFKMQASNGREYEAMLPICAKSLYGIGEQIDMVKSGQGYEQLEGEDISIRRFSQPEFVEWMRKTDQPSPFSKAETEDML
jgi:hypothetical protein